MRTRRPHPLPSPAQPSPATASHPTSSCWRCAGTRASACPTAMSKSYSPSAAWRSTTSPSTGGCCGSRHCWLTPHVHADTRSVPAGGSMRPTSSSPAGAATCTAPSTSPARSLTCWSPRRDATAAHRFFERALGATKITPTEVVTDQAPTYPVVLEALLPAARHRTDRYANNRVECDHGRLKARLRPMRGLKQDRSARVIIAGARPRPERSAWTLRVGRRGAGGPAAGGGVRRPGLGGLICGGDRGFNMLWVGSTQQRPAWRHEVRLGVIRRLLQGPGFSPFDGLVMRSSVGCASGRGRAVRPW
jgi:DDE domain